MNIINYLKGDRKGIEANRLEKDAMNDPFLQEALEGFDAVDDDHMARLEAIGQHIGKGKPQQVGLSLVWKIAIAASVVILALVGKDMFTNSIDAGLQANNMVERPMDIYVPQAFYEENIAVIASMNTELSKDLSVPADRGQKNESSWSETSLEVDVVTPEMAPIDIYLPTKE